MTLAAYGPAATLLLVVVSGTAQTDTRPDVDPVATLVAAVEDAARVEPGSDPVASRAAVARAWRTVGEIADDMVGSKAALDALWKLGRLAYAAGSKQIAHDSWELVL